MNLELFLQLVSFENGNLPYQFPNKYYPVVYNSPPEKCLKNCYVVLREISLFKKYFDIIFFYGISVYACIDRNKTVNGKPYHHTHGIVLPLKDFSGHRYQSAGL